MWRAYEKYKVRVLMSLLARISLALAPTPLKFSNSTPLFRIIAP